MWHGAQARFSVPLRLACGDATSDECEDLLRSILVADPLRRLTLQQIQLHPWFRKVGVPGCLMRTPPAWAGAGRRAPLRARAWLPEAMGQLCCRALARGMLCWGGSGGQSSCAALQPAHRAVPVAGSPAGLGHLQRQVDSSAGSAAHLLRR